MFSWLCVCGDEIWQKVAFKVFCIYLCDSVLAVFFLLIHSSSTRDIRHRAELCDRCDSKKTKTLEYTRARNAREKVNLETERLSIGGNVTGILFLVCSQRSSLRLRTNAKPSAQQFPKSVEELMTDWGLIPKGDAAKTSFATPPLE